jgi:hypothetical protein
MWTEGAKMATSSDFPLDRRHFVAGGSAALLGGCISCPATLTTGVAAAPAPLCDAHAHFFNLSDLPAHGFIKHVLLPERAPNLNPAVAAIVDLFTHVLKPLAPSVARERRGIHFALSEVPEDEVTSERYADLVGARIEREARRSAANPRGAGEPGEALVAARQGSVPDSYFALGVLLNSLDPAAAPSFSPNFSSAPSLAGPGSFERAIQVDRGFLRSVAEGDWDDRAVAMRSSAFDGPIGPPQALLEDRLCPTDDSPPLSLADILHKLSWGYQMLQSRCSHVRRYIRQTRTSAHEPKLMINLLVDYDQWLGDRPSPNSSHAAQIGFWTDFSAAFAGEVAIKTFAGFDPLKLAEQKLMNQPRHFDLLKTCFLNGKSGATPACQGFKLYPPMGFQATGNAELVFDGEERAQKIVGERWRTEPALRGHSVGSEIDRALGDFYDFCIQNGAPVLAHAGRGNAAACGYGQRAHPRHWLELIRQPSRRRLRLCIGHLIDTADGFIKGIEDWESGRPVDPTVWALHGTHELLLLSQTGREDAANVYADLGFMSDFLKGSEDEARGHAARFFAALGRYCRAFDPRCERILFGSDWIMIGHERNYRRYVRMMEHGAEQAGWSHDWTRNLFSENARRFLGAESSSRASDRRMCRAS